MNIVVYRKSDGRVKSLKTIQRDQNPQDYEDDDYAVLEVETLPDLNSKVVSGEVLPVVAGDFPEENLQEAWIKLRQERFSKLSSSDWTQLSDNPRKSSPSWVKYRQDLRDITDQPGAPFNVVWPEPPAM
jgi:hypothetical protein